jgi:hypothetical protein
MLAEMRFTPPRRARRLRINISKSMGKANGAQAKHCDVANTVVTVSRIRLPDATFGNALNIVAQNFPMQL